MCSERGREKERPVYSLSITSSSTPELQVVNSQKASVASRARRGKTDNSLLKTASLVWKVLRWKFFAEFAFRDAVLLLPKQLILYFFSN